MDDSKIFKIPDGRAVGGFPAWEGNVDDIYVEIQELVVRCLHCFATAQLVRIRVPDVSGCYERCVECLRDQLVKHGFLW